VVSSIIVCESYYIFMKKNLICTLFCACDVLLLDLKCSCWIPCRFRVALCSEFCVGSWVLPVRSSPVSQRRRSDLEFCWSVVLCFGPWSFSSAFVLPFLRRTAPRSRSRSISVCAPVLVRRPSFLAACVSYLGFRFLQPGILFHAEGVASLGFVSSSCFSVLISCSHAVQAFTRRSLWFLRQSGLGPCSILVRVWVGAHSSFIFVFLLLRFSFGGKILTSLPRSWHQKWFFVFLLRIACCGNDFVNYFPFCLRSGNLVPVWLHTRRGWSLRSVFSS
jgi:hypothetical protein